MTGDLVHQSTEAIVNPANIRLSHGSGAAQAIAEAAGPDLIQACNDYIRQYGELTVAQPMHTTAGNLPRPITHVIHLAGPESHQYQDKEECHQHLKCAFRNCLQYANKELSARSVSVPAISTGDLFTVNSLDQAVI